MRSTLFCTAKAQKLFDEIKPIVICNTLFIYLDFNKRFDIHTNDSEFHLGSVIFQDGKSIAFYSRKLTRPQTWNTVTEMELLSTV